MVGRRSREIYKSLRTRISQQLQGLLWNTTVYGDGGGRGYTLLERIITRTPGSYSCLLFVSTPFLRVFEGVVRIPKLLRLPFVDVSLLQRERRLPWEYLCEFLVVLQLIDFTLNKNSFWNYNLYCFSNTLNISLSHDLFTFTCRTAEKQIQ